MNFIEDVTIAKVADGHEHVCDVNLVCKCECGLIEYPYQSSGACTLNFHRNNLEVVSICNSNKLVG